MDLQRILFGRITHGSTHTTLGRATVSTLLIRAASAIKSIPVTHKRILIEFNFEEILSDSQQTREMMIEHELESSVIHASEVHDEWKPGVTYERMGEAITAESYRNYSRFCDPVARIGVSEDTIKILRQMYVDEYPDVSQYIPVWIP